LRVIGAVDETPDHPGDNEISSSARASTSSNKRPGMLRRFKAALSETVAMPFDSCARHPTPCALHDAMAAESSVRDQIR
jgi:hypothetical protein